MLFNSILFFIFLSIVFVLYWSSPERYRKLILIISSLIFYANWGITEEGWIGIRWSFHFVSIILFSHGIHLLIFRYPNKKKLFLIVEIIALVLNLSFFKYFHFFLNILADLGISQKIFEEREVFLPLAISFYTFQILAYTIDIYRGVITEKKSFMDYFLFILFFPQLIAGPIMRFKDFFNQRPSLNRDYIYSGLWLLISGLIKKVLIADPMGNIINPVFRSPEVYSFDQILLAGAGFSIQVYCDFSGYTDLARGSAYLLGYQIPENFSAPFFSSSAREVWQRWHITLATWLRDYIYIPLGGNRVSELRTYINQVLTFSLGGLWHGADYTYISWGTMWGVLLSVERFFEKVLKLKTVPTKNLFLIILKILFIFYLFSLGALMFRSQSVSYPEKQFHSVEIMLQLLKGSYGNFHDKVEKEFLENQGDGEFVKSVMGKEFFTTKQIDYLDTFTFYVLMTLFFHWIQYKPEHFARWKYNFFLLFVVGSLTFGILLPTLSTTSQQFIYFVF
ncbi:MAG: MBOAT family protein [Leptospiraceae bacterium]|nr:MBOAT family protein [Leptospiraceae bacterium]MDW7977006.1 MBOAT family O-acyltransferase [Leptospiraceae bacterium]